MKREILFKAKHIHALPENEWMEGKWVEGFLSGEDYINDGTYEYMIDPDTICQYTGLTDKKGRKIWEKMEERKVVGLGEVSTDGVTKEVVWLMKLRVS